MKPQLYTQGWRAIKRALDSLPPRATRCPQCGYVEATTVCRWCKTDKVKS